MQLYSRPDGVYSHRVRFVLAEKGVDAAVIDATDASQELADLNPYGEAPTLVDRDLVLYDSRVIGDYLDERFPHPPLMPVDPIERAKARLVLSRIERDWYRLLDRLEAATTSDDAAEARRWLAESLTASDEVFAANTFFLNDELSMMDCLLGPLLWRLAHYGVELPSSAERTRRYSERLFAEPEFQASLSDVERAMRAV